MSKSLRVRINIAKNFLSIVRFTDRSRPLRLEKEAIFLMKEVEDYYFEPRGGWEFFQADHYVEAPLRRIEDIIERMVNRRNNNKDKR